MFSRKRYPSTLATLLAGLFLLGLASKPARAGDEPEVLLEDDYSTLDPAFGVASDTLGVKDHVLFMTLEKDSIYKWFYESTPLQDADATIRVRLPNPTAAKGDAVGLAFWGFDLSHYYTLTISDEGTYAVLQRVARDRTIHPLPWRKTDVLKTGVGEWNELRVVTVGDIATVYINGKHMGKFKGRPPEDGGLIGIYGEAGDVDAKLECSALKVVAPPKSTAAPSGDPNLLYADKFAALDPGWGEESDRAGVKDGKFHLQSRQNMTYTNLYEGDVFDDVDAAIKVQMHDGDDKSIGYAGLVFWAKSADEYFSFVLAEDGMVGISHWTGKRNLHPMAYQPVPAEAKLNLKGPTALRVVTNGRKATAYVNGASVGTISGQAPEGGSQIGIYSESSDAISTAEFTDLTVRKPSDKAP